MLDTFVVAQYLNYPIIYGNCRKVYFLGVIYEDLPHDWSIR